MTARRITGQDMVIQNRRIGQPARRQSSMAKISRESDTYVRVANRGSAQPRRVARPRSRANRLLTRQKAPAHVVTFKKAIRDLVYAAKTSRSVKVRQSAIAVLQLIAYIAKNPRRSASAADIKAVRSLWWIFSNPVLTAKEKKNHLAELLKNNAFNKPVIRNVILTILASNWGMELLISGRCRATGSRVREYEDPDRDKTVYYMSYYRVIRNCFSVHNRKISRIAWGTRVTPVVHSAYLSLNKRIAQYIMTRVSHLRTVAKRRAQLKVLLVRLKRAVAQHKRRMRKNWYRKGVARYCRRRPHSCAKLRIGSKVILVKRRSGIYRTYQEIRKLQRAR